MVYLISLYTWFWWLVKSYQLSKPETIFAFHPIKIRLQMVWVSLKMLGSLEVADIYLLVRVGWGGLAVIIMKVSVQIGLNWYCQLELSLAILENLWQAITLSEDNLVK